MERLAWSVLYHKYQMITGMVRDSLDGWLTALWTVGATICSTLKLCLQLGQQCTTHKLCSQLGQQCTTYKLRSQLGQQGQTGDMIVGRGGLTSGSVSKLTGVVYKVSCVLLLTFQVLCLESAISGTSILGSIQWTTRLWTMIYWEVVFWL